MEYREQLQNLYHNPKLYEEEYASLNEDVNFWINYIKENRINSVLELGCGSGRIGLKLIPWIKKYAGIDLSSEFLGDFNSKLSSNKYETDVVIKKCDMTNFSLDDEFELIILPFNTISHLYSIDQVNGMLSCVSKHMRDNSKFIIDCFNPSIKFLHTHSQRVLCNEFIMTETNEKISVYETNEYFSDTQVNYIKRFYVNCTRGTELELDLPMKMYYPMELNALLQLNGFSIIKKFGDYSLNSFDSSSIKQITVSEFIK